MRTFLLLAGAALTLSACGGGSTETEANADANAMMADNMMAADNMMMSDPAMMNNTGGMDANMATNTTTENMMMNDLTSNTPDTNLANGM